MSRWFSKPEAPPPEIVEQVEPLEIPVIIEANRRLGRGDYLGAVRGSYPQVANDLAKAFNTPFPTYWTHEEFLRSLDEKTMGHLPEFLRLFYQIYAPVRYGPPGTPIRYGLMAHGPDTGRVLAPAEVPKTLMELLKSIYSQPPMWRLYISLKVPREGGASPEGGNGTDGPSGGPEAAP